MGFCYPRLGEERVKRGSSLSLPRGGGGAAAASGWDPGSASAVTFAIAEAERMEAVGSGKSRAQATEP